MNPLDWLLAILLTYSAVRAAMRGFFGEAFALAGVIFGFLFACWFYRQGAAHLAGLIASPPMAQLAAFLLILVATMVVANLTGKALRRTATAVGLGFFDRLGGALFGLVRGTLLGVSLLLAIAAFLPTAPWLQNSLLAPYFLRAAHAVSFIMPTDLSSKLLKGFDSIKHNAPDWITPGPQERTPSDAGPGR